MTAALEEGEQSAARPSHTLPLRKTQYPFYRRLGGPQNQSRWAENLAPTGIQSRTIQPIVSHYTDWATRPTFRVENQLITTKHLHKKFWPTELLNYQVALESSIDKTCNPWFQPNAQLLLKLVLMPPVPCSTTVKKQSNWLESNKLCQCYRQENLPQLRYFNLLIWSLSSVAPHMHFKRLLFCETRSTLSTLPRLFTTVGFDMAL